MSKNQIIVQTTEKYITATFCQAKVNKLGSPTDMNLDVKEKVGWGSQTKVNIWGPSDSYQKADCFTIQK